MDDQTKGGHFLAVLSHDYWENRLGSDPEAINSTTDQIQKQMFEEMQIKDLLSVKP